VQALAPRIPAREALADLGGTFLEVSGKVVLRHTRRFSDFANQLTQMLDLDEAALRALLGELAELGVNVIEIMPVAEFPGRRGWGYDGVDLFAPSHLYGEPDDFRRFVDHAHSVGIGVILDVVYNHLGPDGNYLKQFSEDYFTDLYVTDWGEAINYEGEKAEPVREFFIANAGYWIDEFHLDGLRLDATQDMQDHGPVHVLADICRRARAAASRGRPKNGARLWAGAWVGGALERGMAVFPQSKRTSKVNVSINIG